MELIEPAQLIRFAAALLFVLGLMGGLMLIMRRLNSQDPIKAFQKRRLQILETLPLDARRKLVLVRRDDREHLVIMGTNSETVIESGIESKQNEPVIPLKNEPSDVSQTKAS